MFGLLGVWVLRLGKILAGFSALQSIKLVRRKAGGLLGRFGAGGGGAGRGGAVRGPVRNGMIEVSFVFPQIRN